MKKIKGETIVRLHNILYTASDLYVKLVYKSEKEKGSVSMTVLDNLGVFHMLFVKIL